MTAPTPREPDPRIDDPFPPQLYTVLGEKRIVDASDTPEHVWRALRPLRAIPDSLEGRSALTISGVLRTGRVG